MHDAATVGEEWVGQDRNWFSGGTGRRGGDRDSGYGSVGSGRWVAKPAPTPGATGTPFAVDLLARALLGRNGGGIRGGGGSLTFGSSWGRGQHYR